MNVKDQKTILLVEDEAITAIAEKTALEKYGYNVITTLSGEEAVAMVEKSPAIDLILMDINLGSGMDGTEAAAIILKKRDIPVVFLSSHMEPEVVAKTEKITSYGYVVKDSSITVLDASIKMAFKLFAAKIRELEKEEALRESEERYHAILEQAADAIFIHDESGRIIEVNQKACRSLGYSREELLSLSIADIDPKAIQTEKHKLWNEILAGKQELFESWHQRKDGNAIPVEVTLGSVRLPENPAVIGIVRDISERKQAEEVLQESEERMRAIVEGTPHLFFYLQDAEANTIYVSPTIERITGYKADAWVKRRDWFITDASINQAAREMTKAHLRGEFDKKSVLMEIRHANGNPLLLEAFEYPIIKNEKVVGLQGVAHDITQRQLTERTLHENEERLRGILFSMADWVWEVDEKSVYTYSSEKGEALLGYSHEDIIGRTPFDFMPAEEAARVAPVLAVIMAEKGIIKDLENWKLGKNGESICLLTNGVPILDEKGNLKGYRGVDKDITERKRAEAALLESESKYRELIESHIDVIFSVDAIGKIEYISPAITSITGYTQEEVTGKNLFDFFGQEERKRYAAQMQQTMEGGSSIGEFLITVKDRSSKWIRASSKCVVENGKVTGIRGIMSDISERKQAEKEKEQVISLQKATIESTADSILVINHSGKIMDFNQRFAKMWHIPDSILETRDDAQLLRFALEQVLDPQEFLAKVNELYAAPEQESFDLLQFKDGRCFERYSRPQLLSGRPVGRVWSFRDISARQQAGKLTEALYKISQAIYATDNLDELFKHVHHALADIIPTDNFFIALLSDEGKSLTFPYFVDEKDPDNASTIEVDNEKSLTVEVFKKKKALLFDEPELRKRYATGRSLLWGTAPKCWLGVPLIMRETVIGVLAVQDYHKSGAYSHKDVALLESAAGQISIAIDRKRAEEALRASEERYRSILNASPDGIGITDMEGRILMVSPSVLSMVGCKREEEILGRLFTDFVSLDDRHRASSDVKRMSQNAMMGLGEYHGLRADGRAIDLEVNGEFILDADRRPTQMVFIIRDIAERKRTEEEIQRQLAEKEILLKEVHHRIKNNFASVSGLLSLQARAIDDPKATAVLQDAIGRVDSMRILYDKLLLSEDHKDVSVKKYLDDLIDSIFAIFPNKAKIVLEKRIEDFHLSAKQLFPVGVIINEILTNTMKHAFGKRPSGLIEVALTKDKNHVTLTIQNNGKKLPAGFDINDSKGFGLMLVKMLSQQLGGSFSMESHKGTRCTIEFDI